MVIEWILMVIYGDLMDINGNYCDLMDINGDLW